MCKKLGVDYISQIHNMLCRCNCQWQLGDIALDTFRVLLSVVVYDLNFAPDNICPGFQKKVLEEGTILPVALNTLATVYRKKYAHGFVVLCFVVVMQSFIMNSHEVFIHIHRGCFAGTGAIVRLLQCQWSKPDGYGKISQCIITTKQKLCAYFLGYTVHRRPAKLNI